MVTLLYLPPFLSTRRFDRDTSGMERLFRGLLSTSGVRRRSLAVEARFPSVPRLNNEFHHTGEIGGEDLTLVVRSTVNPVYARSIDPSILDDTHALPSALGLSFQSISPFAFPSVDGVLLSSQSASADRNLADRYLKKGVPVFYFDNLDREPYYENLELAQQSVDELAMKYTLCFIKDLPVELELPANVIPIAPVPVAAALLDIIVAEIGGNMSSDKGLPDATFGFFGRRRPGVCRDERQAMLDVSTEIDGGVGIVESTGMATLRMIYNQIGQSRYLLSPSGRVWCSFRHTELAGLGKPILMNEPNCHTFETFSYPKQLLVPSLKNAVQPDYGSYLDQVRMHLKGLPEAGQGLAAHTGEWLAQVRKFHTREARGRSYAAKMLEHMR